MSSPPEYATLLLSPKTGMLTEFGFHQSEVQWWRDHNLDVIRCLSRITVNDPTAFFIVASWELPPKSLNDSQSRWFDDFEFSIGPTYSQNESFIAQMFKTRERVVRRLDISEMVGDNITDVPAKGAFNKRFVEICCGQHSTLQNKRRVQRMRLYSNRHGNEH